MSDFLVAAGLALAFEGVLYAATPGGMKAFMRQALGLDDRALRLFGLGALITGVCLVWLVRG